MSRLRLQDRSSQPLGSSRLTEFHDRRKDAQPFLLTRPDRLAAGLERPPLTWNRADPRPQDRRRRDAQTAMRC